MRRHAWAQSRKSGINGVRQLRISGRAIGRGRREASRKNRVLWALFLITAVALAAAVWIDMSMRPVIENIVAYQARIQAARLVNEAVLEQLERGGADYDRLVRLTRSGDGEVMSIEADMMQINRLKSLMSASVVARLTSEANREFSVPAGTLMGNHFTSGRGPMVVIKTVPTGYVQSEIYNKFSSAGINQTLHQIMLDVNVQTLAVLPGYSVKTETVTNICIAETIIVGKIPQGYASIGGEPATYFSFSKEK